MWTNLQFNWNKRRARGAMQAYLDTPLPNRHQYYGNCSYLALDLETTGLNPAKDSIISVGMVQIDGLHIRLATAQHLYIQISHSVEQSAIYHGILDSYIADAAPLAQVLPCILAALAGRILIVHGAAIDLPFLNAACQKIYGIGLRTYIVDTMALAKRHYHLEQREIPADGLRLHTLRQAYCLPTYQGHHALTDALATAELFLAMSSKMAGKSAMQARRLVTN